MSYVAKYGKEIENKKGIFLIWEKGEKG